MPNSDMYIKMLVRMEAVKTSEIAGINIALEDALLSLEDVESEKTSEWQKVQNAIEAIEYGKDKISEEPFVSAKLIKEIHKVLTGGDILAPKASLGKFRTSQNWVGTGEVTDAIYVPPPHTELVECFTDFEKFVNNDDIDTPHLVKIAMLHYQFESILPFLDGNGRIGRLIVPLYFQSKGLLDKSCLYISDYIDENRNKYYDKLTKVRNISDIIRIY